jgi:hypothetical protein
MARKRLADLLREEANKPEDSDQNQPPVDRTSEAISEPTEATDEALVLDEVEAPTIASVEQIAANEPIERIDPAEHDRLKAEFATLQQQAATLQQQASERIDPAEHDRLKAEFATLQQRAAALQQQVSERIDPAEHDRLKAEFATLQQQAAALQQQVSERIDPAEHDRLKAEFALSQNREATLQQQVSDLQTELTEQQNQVKILQAHLIKAESLKPELDQAKKAALQLAEANTQLKAELTASQPQSQPPRSQSPKAPSPTNALVAKSALQQRQVRSLAHPVFPNADSTSQLSNQDLGWVD